MLTTFEDVDNQAKNFIYPQQSYEIDGIFQPKFTMAKQLFNSHLCLLT
jgi:hypothetical protein